MPYCSVLPVKQGFTTYLLHLGKAGRDGRCEENGGKTEVWDGREFESETETDYSQEAERKDSKGDANRRSTVTH